MKNSHTIIGLQWLIFAFVFNGWLLRRGVPASRADPAANLAITVGLLWALSPMLLTAYRKLRAQVRAASD